MSRLDPQPAEELARLVNGYRVSQAIYVAATLGIADLLAGGARASDELAAETGADPRSLYRLLRALASVGVFREEDGRRFALTEVGDGLRSDAPEGIAGWAAFIGSRSHWQAWGDLVHSVRTGENAFRHVHGTDVWSYRAQRPEESAGFDRTMRALTNSANRAPRRRVRLRALRNPRRRRRRERHAPGGASRCLSGGAGRALRRAPRHSRCERGPERGRRGRPLPGQRRELLRRRPGRRRRLRAQGDHPRLGGRGVDRDPPLVPSGAPGKRNAPLDRGSTGRTRTPSRSSPI